MQLDNKFYCFLPEIALTTQLVSRLAAYFGNQIAVFHSKYNTNERIEVWYKLIDQNNTTKIVLGVRSALFCHLQI